MFNIREHQKSASVGSKIVITAIVGTLVLVLMTSTMRVGQQVYAPTTCASCAKIFAPGQLSEITGNPATLFAAGQRAALTGEPASQFAPGQEAKNLNSPG